MNGIEGVVYPNVFAYVIVKLGEWNVNDAGIDQAGIVDAIELHYGKCRTQNVWSLTHSSTTTHITLNHWCIPIKSVFLTMWNQLGLCVK